MDDRLGVCRRFIAAQLFPQFERWVYSAAAIVSIVPVVRRAYASATTGTPFSIETLMSVAAIGALVIGAAEEAAVVIFLFAVGELLETVAAGRARSAIKRLWISRRDKRFANRMANLKPSLWNSSP